MTGGGSAEPGGDPFGTADLRRAVLASWRDSPTRFREDANAEEDLRFGGYRDRLVVELAQNAADAAALAWEPGVLRVTRDGRELSFANTGRPLDRAGVAALASLRASTKRGAETVGRFGVGFAAVLGVADEITVRSRTGGVAFSAERSRSAAAELPELAGELADRAGAVPVLRLPWPAEPVVPQEDPAGEFATEVRLRVRDDLDPAAVLAACAAQAADLLLALPSLHRIEVGSGVGAVAWWRVDDPDGATLHSSDGPPRRWLLSAVSGELSVAELDTLGTEARRRPQWTVCWAIPVDADGRPVPIGERAPDGVEVLHAPTATDERMSLPARLIATLPIDPARRRVHPSGAADTVLADAAAHYPDVLPRLTPEDRTALVPLPGFPVSDVDGRLRDGVLAALRGAAWLPSAAGPELEPSRAVVLDSGSTELARLLADVIPGLLDAEFAAPKHAGALSALGVRRIPSAEITEAIAGLDRNPSWWHGLYAELAALVSADPPAAAELGALPVPLADGRTVIGPRDVLLPDADAELLAVLSTMDELGMRIVHPVAAHPLLERLGARSAGPAELLDDPALQDAVERSVDDAEAGLDVRPLADAVLVLADRAGLRPGERPWLGALALPDSAGDPRRADELVHPDSPLRAVWTEALDDDGLLGVLAAEVAEHRPRPLLAAVGVLDSWSVLVVDEPAGPEHDLDAEDRWWDWRSAERPPDRLIAVRDLDLVDADAWPRALRLLLADPQAKRALDEPDGYTAWWIVQYARLGGRPPRHWRLPDARRLAGLYDPVPEPELPPEPLAVIGVRADLHVANAADAADLLRRLGDPERVVAPGTALDAHRELAAAVRDGRVDPSTVDPPERVRSLSGAVVDAEEAAVLDGPWLLGVVDPARLVAAGGRPDDLDQADALADLLDLPLATDDHPAEPADRGTPERWTDIAGVAETCALLGADSPDGGVVRHTRLRIRLGGDNGETAGASWWLDREDAVHAADSPDGLARALCWRLGRWDDRHRAAALLAAPDLRTLLG